jgi:hypothetical protein
MPHQHVAPARVAESGRPSHTWEQAGQGGAAHKGSYSETAAIFALTIEQRVTQSSLDLVFRPAFQLAALAQTAA